jgi:hypothetical protein
LSDNFYEIYPEDDEITSEPYVAIVIDGVEYTKTRKDFEKEVIETDEGEEYNGWKIHCDNYTLRKRYEQTEDVQWDDGSYYGYVYEGASRVLIRTIYPE